jgi:hypothetical protein
VFSSTEISKEMPIIYVINVRRNSMSYSPSRFYQVLHSPSLYVCVGDLETRKKLENSEFFYSLDLIVANISLLACAVCTLSLTSFFS